MFSSEDQKMVYNLKLSSVGPSQVTGTDVTRDLNGIDLAMKLHYIKGVYFFDSQASEGLTVTRFKESMFYWSNEFYVACGRYRRSDTGRPYLKCNDCGVRFVEAQCDKTIDEWIEMRDCSLNDGLVYHLPIGPELFFSPPIYMQVTKFKCGGMSLGISWAHVLGDAFTATYSISRWSQYLAGLKSKGPETLPKPSAKPETYEFEKEPLSLKRVEPVGDHWVTANNCKMEAFSFYLTASQASHMHSKIWGQSQVPRVSLFESLCAIMWQCVAKVREGLEPKTVTLCKKDPDRQEDGSVSNNQLMISSVQADFDVAKSDVKKLASLLVDQAVDERVLIEAAVEKDNGVSDYIVYGANLTFLDFENANLYALEWNGKKPEFVSYGIHGIGDQGAVCVLPWPEVSGKEGNIQGKIVNVSMPENEIAMLKLELKKSGLLVDGHLD